MAITASLVGSALADNVDRTSYTIPSSTLVANKLYKLDVAAGISAGTAQPPTITDNHGMTWVLAEDATFGTANGMWTYVAYSGASPTVGTIVLGFGGVTQLYCDAHVAQIDDAYIHGASALDAVVQGKEGNTAGATSLSIALDAAPSGNSRCFSAFLLLINEAMTPRTSWDELADAGHTNPGRRLESQYRSDAAEQTGSASWTTSAGARGTVLEIKPARGEVTLTPATVALSAEATSPVPQPVTVNLTVATVALDGVAVTAVPQPVTVGLTAAVVALDAVETTPEPQPIEVALTAVDVVFTAVEVVPTPAGSEVTLTAAVVALEAVATDPQGQPGLVELAAAIVALSGVALDPQPQPVTVTLTVATLTLAAPALDPDAQPVTVSLVAASFTLDAVPVDAQPQPGLVVLTAAVVALAAQPLTATPGAVEMTLTAAVLVLVAVMAQQRDLNPIHVTFREHSHVAFREHSNVRYREPATTVTFREG